MRHHNSLMHELLQFIPWGRFEQLVDEHGADKRVRRLDSKSQLVALLHAQLSGAASLREIAAPISCTSGRSMTSPPNGHRRNPVIPIRWTSRYAEPDSRGLPVASSAPVYPAHFDWHRFRCGGARVQIKDSLTNFVPM